MYNLEFRKIVTGVGISSRTSQKSKALGYQVVYNDIIFGYIRPLNKELVFFPSVDCVFHKELMLELIDFITGLEKSKKTA